MDECTTCSSHSANLTDDQRREIIEYGIHHIYYTGKQINESFPSDSEIMKNEVVQDRNGVSKICVGDHIMFQYELVAILGQGSFGTVSNCYDHKTKKSVAIKMISMTDKDVKLDKELTMLLYLHKRSKKAKNYIVTIDGAFMFRGFRCIVMELFPTDLYDFIWKQKPKGLSEIQVKSLIMSLLKAVEFIHKLSIVHADLKPGNIAVTDHFTIKLFDFGFACFKEHLKGQIIQTRNYRAPEIFMKLPSTKAIDTWSIGCIVYEMLTGYCLFSKQLNCNVIPHICEILGNPDRSLAKHWRRLSTLAKLNFTTKGFPILQNQQRSARYFKQTQNKLNATSKPIEESLLSCAYGVPSEACVDFIKKCLLWDDTNRVSCERALDHRWFKTTPEPIDTDPIKEAFPNLPTRSSQSYPTLFLNKLPEYYQNGCRELVPKIRQPAVVITRRNSYTNIQ